MNIIEKALQNLPGNWHKGSGSDGKNYCGVVHVSKAILDDDIPITNKIAACNIMGEVALEQFPERAGTESTRMSLSNFILFNDHPDTTEADVIMVMEKAAVRLDEKV